MLRNLFRLHLKPCESGLFGLVPVRTKGLLRTPVTDTTKLVPLLDETQLFVPVVHRRHPVPLRKVNGPSRRLRSRHYVYDEIVPPKQPMPDVEVILTHDVPGKGVKGTMLTVAGDKAYAEFLLPQFAVYATPENKKKYASLIEDVHNNVQFSTLSAQKTALKLSQIMVFFKMNMINPWTIEKWHARVAFRQAGIILSDDCIELPPQPISGPDPAKQDKHFMVTVVINEKERVPVLCRINHFINDEDQKLPISKHFTLPIEPVFEEDRALIDEHVRKRGEIKLFKF